MSGEFGDYIGGYMHPKIAYAAEDCLDPCIKDPVTRRPRNTRGIAMLALCAAGCGAGYDEDGRMGTVYIVTSGEYSRYSIEGVFSTQVLHAVTLARLGV